MSKKLFRISSFVIGAMSIAAYSLVATAYAVNVTPSSGSFTAGSTQTFELVAAPTATGQNAVSVDIDVTGMTITAFTPTSDVVGSIPDCTGGTRFTSTEICVSYAKSTDFQAGDSLGTFTATMGSAGTATITKAAGNEYADGTTTVADTGVAGTYTITSSTTGGGTTGGGTTGGGTTGGGTTVLPNTSITSSNGSSNVLFLVVGLSLIALGALTFVSFDTIKLYKDNRSDFDNNNRSDF